MQNEMSEALADRSVDLFFWEWGKCLRWRKVFACGFFSKNRTKKRCARFSFSEGGPILYP